MLMLKTRQVKQEEGHGRRVSCKEACLGERALEDENNDESQRGRSTRIAERILSSEIREDVRRR